MLKPVYLSKMIIKLNSVLIIESLDCHGPHGVLQLSPKRGRNLLAATTPNLESTEPLLELARLRGFNVLDYKPHSRNQAAARRLGQGETAKLAFAIGTSPDHVTVGRTRIKVHPFFRYHCNVTYVTALIT